MGLTMDHRNAQDLLAAYALDAVDADEVARARRPPRRVPVVRRAPSPCCAAPPPSWPACTPTTRRHGSASRTLRAAAERRARPLIEPADAVEVHGIEADRLALLLATITDRTSGCVSAGPMFPDWTVHDLTAHLAATETLLAAQLGVHDLSPDTATTAEPPGPRGRRPPPRARAHRRRRRVQRGGDGRVAGRHHLARLRRARHHRPGSASSCPSTIALTHRAFEIWTHADDIRVALGLDRLPPPPSSLVTMSRTVLDGLPFMMLVADAEHPGRVAELQPHRLGRRHLHHRPRHRRRRRSRAAESPDVHVELDVVDFCRAIGDRIEPSGLSYHTTGDTRLGADLIRSLPVLAIL